MSLHQPFWVHNMRFKRTVIAAILAGCGATAAQAGALYFDFNQNSAGSIAAASLFLFGKVGQQATVSNLAGFNQTVTLDDDGFFNLGISNSYQQFGTGVRNTGFEVNSSSAIAGYFINRAGFSTDMTYLLDKQALGKEYVVASQGGGFGEGSQIQVHAIEDNTQITLTPRGSGPISVTLAKGETYKYAGGTVDLTGSTISATKNVAVFSGHECAQVPSGTTFCDTLIEQAISTDKLSKNYLLTASKGADIASTGSDLVRIVGTADNTTVKLNGALVATIDRGETYEFSLAAGAGAKVEASQAVAVAQYLKGGQGANTDPAMSYVPGQDTWLDAYRLATPSGTAAFSINYAAVVIKDADMVSLALNGALVNTSGFSPIAGTGHSRGIVDLGLGLFDLAADSPFLVMLGGGSNADSYFTYGGSTFAPGISPPPPPPPNGVPEPGSLLLALGALGALAGVSRRRRAA